MSLKIEIKDLTAEDIASIKKKTKMMIFILSLVEIFFTALVFSMIKDFKSFFVVFGAIFVLFPLGMIVFLIYNTKKDLASGKKRVLTGRVTRKYERTTTSRSGSGSSSSTRTSTSYYLELENEKMTVEGTEYNKAHEGDLVEIEQTTSGNVLKLTNLQSSISDSPQSLNSASSTNNSNYEFNERIVFLENEEIDFLKSKKNKALIRFIITSVIGGYILDKVLVYGFVIVLAISNLKLPRALTSNLLFYIFPCLVLLLIFWRFKRKILPLINEINAGNKKVVDTFVGDKMDSNVKILNNSWKETTNRGEFMYLVIAGKYYDVSPKNYSLFEGGEKITAHYTLESKRLLKIESKNEKGKFILFY